MSHDFVKMFLRLIFTEAVVQKCSIKKVLLNISKILMKTPVPESLFLIKMQA